MLFKSLTAQEKRIDIKLSFDDYADGYRQLEESEYLRF